MVAAMRRNSCECSASLSPSEYLRVQFAHSRGAKSNLSIASKSSSSRIYDRTRMLGVIRIVAPETTRDWGADLPGVSSWIRNLSDVYIFRARAHKRSEL